MWFVCKGEDGRGNCRAFIRRLFIEMSFLGNGKRACIAGRDVVFFLLPILVVAFHPPFTRSSSTSSFYANVRKNVGAVIMDRMNGSVCHELPGFCVLSFFLI